MLTQQRLLLLQRSLVAISADLGHPAIAQKR
jgi:hypothetical protein